MNFKIDTSGGYTVIAPETITLTAGFADELAAKASGLAQNGSINLIVDLELAEGADDAFPKALALLHERFYSNNSSIVFARLRPALVTLLKEADVYHDINVAPTFREAADIISMEIVERELLSEDAYNETDCSGE